ncbi:hypothetical protein EMIT047CA2_60200 [Pseudomonas soli]
MSRWHGISPRPLRSLAPRRLMARQNIDRAHEPSFSKQVRYLAMPSEGGRDACQSESAGQH